MPFSAMTDSQALGMWQGLFVGDAMGVPLEFTKPTPKSKYVTTMTAGGVHNASLGEYSDDGSMALAIADAYITCGGFDATQIQRNFVAWKATGKYGTRPGPAWDCGLTISESLVSVTDYQRPYAGSTAPMTSGNGCIMRMAPCIVFNRHSLSAAIGDSVAQCLLTHGSADSIKYTAALAHELWLGKAMPEYDSLRDRPINNSGYVADTYASAWYSVKRTNTFEKAIFDAINRGGDTDTVGAVTGMIAGRIYGVEQTKYLFEEVINSSDINSLFQAIFK
jgi:ADP-ribosyl-[dinitrogen reductase] hydrolase